jgi:DnaJ family protein C protein 3
VHTALGARKFSNAANLMVGDSESSGLIADVKADVVLGYISDRNQAM